MTADHCALAVDVGGTKFAAAAVCGDGTVLTRTEIPVPRTTDPAAVTGALRTAVDRVLARVPEDRLIGAGVGSAGPLDRRAGAVSPVNIPAWRAFPLVEQIAEWLPGLPVRLAGDAQCMALGEWWREPGPAGETVLGIVVSTGIGGGIVIDGAPYFGPTGNAGHIGHMPMDPDGQRCPCGGTGCVETVASGPSMVRWARANGWSGHCPDADVPDAAALAADARAGSPIAELAFRRAADALAAAILSAAALLDLDRVIVGGGVAQAGDVLLRPLRAALAEQAGPAFLHRLRVEAGALGRDAGLYGAAALIVAP